MATFDTYWNALAAKQPQLNDDETVMKISVGALRKALQHAYAAGDEDRRKAVDAVEKLRRTLDPAGDILGDIFGRRK